MKLMKRIYARADERGVALPFVALMLTLLIGMTALAVDLGWLYLNGSRVQRGADAAALAGVVHLPHNNAGVDENVIGGANANGWNIGMLNGDDSVGSGPDVARWQPLSENRLEVELEARVPTFFMRVFGMDEVTITRRATAEYIKPVPMGSPSSCFGIVASEIPQWKLNDAGLGHCSAWAMNFWAAINGPYTPKEQGDPFATACHNPNGSATGCSGGSSNSQYRPSGYYYGIEVPSGKTEFRVKIYDAGFYQRPVSNPCQYQTGDCIADGAGVTTHYTLYAPDDTPLDPTDNDEKVCDTYTVGPGNNSTINNWVTTCIGSGAPGIYVLNVRTTGGGGNNSYAVGVTVSPSSGEQARVYAINDMSIFTNSGGSSVATVYLAEVDESHAGKTLLLDFFDPGENPTGNAWVEVRNPHNGSAACTWNATNGNGSGGGPVNPCRIRTTISGTAQYNGHWINSRINIPSSYTCAGTASNPYCYWTMRLELGSTSQDRTTWAARVIGNPVRLVPNHSATP